MEHVNKTPFTVRIIFTTQINRYKCGGQIAFICALNMTGREENWKFWETNFTFCTSSLSRPSTDLKRLALYLNSVYLTLLALFEPIKPRSI